MALVCARSRANLRIATLFAAGAAFAVLLASFLEDRTGFNTPGAAIALAILGNLQIVRRLGLFVAIDVDAGVILSLVSGLYLICRGRLWNSRL